MSQCPNDVVTWFELPVSDLSRAMDFYATVLGVEMGEPFDTGTTKMSVFPIEGQGVHGALVQGEHYEPCQKGALLYLNGGEDLSVPLSRVAAAGGMVLAEKFSIGEHGYIALFVDTEGNRLALHSLR